MATQSLDEATDEELLDRFVEGRDQRAFAQLIRRHGQMVMAAVRRVLRSSEDAEDAFQATFLALAKAAEKLRCKSSVAAWLNRTAGRCALSVLRSNNRWSMRVERMTEQREMTADVDKSTDEPSKGVANAELEAILDEEIWKLPTNLQAAIVLCDLESLTRKEAAQQLGVSVTTATHYVTKARKLLCERLVRRGVTTSLAGIAAYFRSSTESQAALSAQLIRETTAKAFLFSAGKAATDVGVSSTIFNTANEVISTMTKARFIALGLAALATIVFAGALAKTLGFTESTVQAGYIFQETFNDGNYADGSPVTWQVPVLSKGTVEILSGDIALTSTDETDIDEGISVAAYDVSNANTSTRAIVRLAEQSGANWGATIGARVGDTIGYYATVMYMPSLGGNVMFMVTGSADDDGVATTELFNSVTGTVSPLLDYDLRKVDTAIQLDVFDNHLQAWAWPAGEEMPTQPQFDVFDDSITNEGHVQFGLVTARPFLTPEGVGQVTFREISVANVPIHEIVPEPTTAALSSMGFIFLLACRRNYRIACGKS